MKRQLPDTSKSAYKEAQNGLIADHKEKIISALGRIGTANYEAIAKSAGLDRHAVGRRISELEEDGLICKPGSKSKTKTGRMAYNYQLTEQGSLNAEHPVTPLINSINKPIVHNPLFD